ncbi:hypothetical protein [Spirosoma gilvum]
MLKALFPIGRILLALALVLLGLIHLIGGNFPVALLPIPTQAPQRDWLVLLMGSSLLLAGLGIGFNWKAAPIACGLGILFGGLALVLHVPPLVRDPFNGNAWTVLGELLAFSGGMFYVAGCRLPTANTYRLPWQTYGRYLLAAALLMFAILHGQYADYIATLIPAWIPATLFWAYFVGVAFGASALSFTLNRQISLSAGLLGLMFFGWVLVLHVPRVATKPHSEPEWTSLSVALMMSGICWLLTGSRQQSSSPVDTLPTSVGHTFY